MLHAIKSTSISAQVVNKKIILDWISVLFLSCCFSLYACTCVYLDKYSLSDHIINTFYTTEF